MSKPIRWNAHAAEQLLTLRQLRDLHPRLNKARDEMRRDIELFNAGSGIPVHKLPLDAGFIEYPQRLLDNDAELSRIEQVAAELRAETDSVVVLGIGGSYMGARALFEALCHPYHNELPRAKRNQVPRIYFEGNNVENDCTTGLLELLKNRAAGAADSPASKWSIVVISKSGGTMETAVSFRLFRDALEECYGSDSDAARRYVVPVTGASGKLRSLAQAKGYEHERTFEVPDGIGGRFSVFCPVGLLPAAVMGLDIRQLLQGAADITTRFFSDPAGNNPVIDSVGLAHLMEADQGCHIRVLSTWGARLEAVGLWYDQLLAESIGKHEQGATPLTVVNTRDLHSRGQQHQEGRRDKLITNLVVEAPGTAPLEIPKSDFDQDQLNRFAGRTMPQILDAAIDGTNQAYADVGRPTADLILPELSEHVLGQLLQMLMLSTVLEGRLINVNPYGQPGVEAYKQNMLANLSR